MQYICTKIGLATRKFVVITIRCQKYSFCAGTFLPLFHFYWFSFLATCNYRLFSTRETVLHIRICEVQPDCRFVHIYRYFKGSSYLHLPGTTRPRHIPPNSFPPSSNQFFENTCPFLFFLFHFLHIQSLLQGWRKCSLSPERIASTPKLCSTTAYWTSSRIFRCSSCHHLVCGCWESRAHGTCCVSENAS